MKFTKKGAHCREGWETWKLAACKAAKGKEAAHLECLRYLLELDQGFRLIHLPTLMRHAALSGSIEALELVHAAGGVWTGRIPTAVASSGNADALRYALQHAYPDSWDEAMAKAIKSRSLDCVKALYEKEFNEHRSASPEHHPALEAVRCGWLEGLKFVAFFSGAPKALLLDCTAAVQGGVEMLKYTHERGALLDARTLAAAIRADSLPCLKYAHQHGCPHGVVGDDLLDDVACARSVSVLRYVCEHMDPTWAGAVLECTARHLPLKAEQDRTSRHDEQLWQLVLYLGQKLGTDLPGPLAEAVAVRKERAAALAGVFWKAEKYQREDGRKPWHADAEWVAMWEVMARVSKELRDVIAREAHLILL
jgi:hypothetical protein